MIDSFTEKHRFLSNFWPALVEYDNLVYPTVEHAYVAAKTVDADMRALIIGMAMPGQVKRLGRKLILRDGWDDMKLTVMEQLLRQKFKHDHLARMLVATGDAELVEGNTWGDTFWGVCNGVGENHLGKLLMRVRADICN